MPEKNNPKLIPKICDEIKGLPRIWMGSQIRWNFVFYGCIGEIPFQTPVGYETVVAA